MSVNMSGTEPGVRAVDPSLQFSPLISAGVSSVQSQRGEPRLGLVPDPAGHCWALWFGSVMLRKSFFPQFPAGFLHGCWRATGRSGPVLGHAASLGTGIGSA